MAIVIPQPNCWLRKVVFIAQCTQARCAQEEEFAGARLQAEPATSEHSQEVTAGKKQHITFDRAQTLDHAVRPRTDLAR